MISSQILIVCLFYISSHILRIIRLGILTIHESQYRSKIILAQASTSLLTLFFPFKLGEIVRVYSFVQICKDNKSGIVIWAIDRIPDVFFISSYIVLLYIINARPSGVFHVFLIILLFLSDIILCLLLLTFFLSDYLTRRLVLTSLSKRSHEILKHVNKINSLKRNVTYKVSGRVTPLLIITLLIWLCELCSMKAFAGFSRLSFTDLSSLLSDVFVGSFFTKYRSYWDIQFFCLLVLNAMVYTGYFIFSGKHFNLKQ